MHQSKEYIEIHLLICKSFALVSTLSRYTELAQMNDRILIIYILKTIIHIIISDI